MSEQENLNLEQNQAANFFDGPLLILAGAGTGKTKVIVHRIINLIEQQKARPHEILAVTFTNKAANEMMERCSKFIDPSGIWIGTFHSLSTRILRVHADLIGHSKDFAIIDVDEQWSIISKIIKDKNLDDKKYQVKYIAYLIEKWKNLNLLPEQLNKSDLHDHFQMKVHEIYIEYQGRLKLLNAMDFGDLLVYCCKIFSNFPDILENYQNRFRYLLVDEYQDTNICQYLWLRYLAQKNKNICAVGDEDQSIYGWRGAEIANIIRFNKDFPNANTIRLEQNYRSTDQILQTANHLIAHNKTRIGKNLWTKKQSDEKVEIVSLTDAYKEGRFIARKIGTLTIPRNQIAVLVRASFQTRLIEEALIEQNIPYRIVGGLKFYDRLEIKNSLAYLRLCFNKNDSLAFERIINVPKRGIGLKTLEQIRQYSLQSKISYFDSLKNMLSLQLFKGKIALTLQDFILMIEKGAESFSMLSVEEACRVILNQSQYLDALKEEKTNEAEARIENIQELISNISEYDSIASFLEHVSLVNHLDNQDQTNMVKIMTMHGAKGLEFSMVFLPGWEEGIFPSKKSIEESPSALEEERRLAYVAMTRAKEKLYITHAFSRQVYRDWQSSPPSRFIDEIKNLSSVKLTSDNANLYQKHSDTKFIVQKILSNVKDESILRIGDRVDHTKFGSGFIISMSGDHIEVNFMQYGAKRILASYLKKL